MSCLDASYAVSDMCLWVSVNILEIKTDIKSKMFLSPMIFDDTCPMNTVVDWFNFQDGFTPLTVSVREDQIEMAEFLLKEGAGVNVMDQAKRSVLNKDTSAIQ